MQYIFFGNQNGFSCYVWVLFIGLGDDEIFQDGSQV